MPRRKTRKKTGKGPNGQIGWGGMGARPWGRANLVLGMIAALALVAGGLYWWRGDQANSEFGALAMQGRAALSQVRTPPARGAVNGVSWGQCDGTEAWWPLGCRVGPSGRSSAPGTIGTTRPAALQMARASFARATGRPDTVVMPTVSQRGWARR